MRILLVTGSFPPMQCGVGDYVFRLAGALAAISAPTIQVGVLTSTDAQGAKAPAGVDLFPVVKNWRIAEVPFFVRTVNAWAPDIVHIQYPSQGYDSVLMASLLPAVSFLMLKKVVQTWHEFETCKRLLVRSLPPCEIAVVRPEYKRQLPKLLRVALYGKRFTYIPSASSITKVNLSAADRSVARNLYLSGQSRLLVFFGFVYAHKGVDILFDIGDPARDRIIIAGGFDEKSEYGANILRRANSEPWKGKADVLGFVSTAQISALLSVADAVVLPFRGSGGGEWNSSIHAALLHQAFVLTTSTSEHGYCASRNIFFSRIDDVAEMRAALEQYAGLRRAPSGDIQQDDWRDIGERHARLYSALLK